MANDCKGTYAPVAPLLENAIQHGLLKKQEGGNVAVSIGWRDNQIHFCVADDGDGMEQKRIDAALTSNRSGEGVALCNIHKRLIRIYGKGLTITGASRQGTQVCWSVPVRKKGKKA